MLPGDYQRVLLFETHRRRLVEDKRNELTRVYHTSVIPGLTLSIRKLVQRLMHTLPPKNESPSAQQPDIRHRHGW